MEILERRVFKDLSKYSFTVEAEIYEKTKYSTIRSRRSFRYRIFIYFKYYFSVFSLHVFLLNKDNLSRQELDNGFLELSAACRLAAATLEQTMSNHLSSTTSVRPAFNKLLESARAYSNTRDKASTYLCYDLAISSTSESAWMTSLEGN